MWIFKKIILNRFHCVLNLKHNFLSIMGKFCPLYPQQLPHTPFNFFPRNLIQYVLPISLFILYTWYVLSLLLFVPHSESLLIFIPLQNFSIIFFKPKVYLIFNIYLFSLPTLLCSFYCALLISYIFNFAFNSLLICLNQIILLAELIACLILVFILSAESCFLIWFSHAFFLEPGYVLQCISSFQNPVKLKLKAFLCWEIFICYWEVPWCAWAVSEPHFFIMHSLGL